MLAWARSSILKLKVAPKLFGSAAFFFLLFFLFFFEKKKNVALRTAPTRVTRQAARPSLDDNVPKTCTGTGHPELRQAVPFSKRYVRHEQKTPTSRENGEYLVQDNASKRKLGKLSYPLPPKKNV